MPTPPTELARVHLEPQRLRTASGVILAAAKLATLRYVAESVIDPHQPKYKGKAMRVRAVGYIGGLAMIPAAWWLRGRRERFPVVGDLAVTLPLLVDAAGNAHGIYDEARIDDVVHLVNTVSLGALFGALISEHVDSRAKAAGAVIALGVVGGIGWEVMEYTAEALGFEGLGLSPEDTIADVTFGAMGALIAAAITWARWQPLSSRRSLRAAS
ncbi:MAG: hypothetical protein M3452_01810 [Chloroflexota bacterium]|nr:hypothetical protein [Chloroflexota bacterium]